MGPNLFRKVLRALPIRPCPTCRPPLPRLLPPQSPVRSSVPRDVLDAGSTGEALNAAGGAGDPWITALPGAYAVGQAGNILGAVVQAGVTAIQAKVTALTFTSANRVDANIHAVANVTVTGFGTVGNTWGPA